jgi:hypothetical protein
MADDDLDGLLENTRAGDWLIWVLLTLVIFAAALYATAPVDSAPPASREEVQGD